MQKKKSNKEIDGKIEYQSTSDVVGMGKQPINVDRDDENKPLSVGNDTEEIEYQSTTGIGEQSNNVNEDVEKKHPEKEPPRKITSLLKKHKCIYCNYQSDRVYNIKIHIERKHLENKPPG